MLSAAAEATHGAEVNVIHATAPLRARPQQKESAQTRCDHKKDRNYGCNDIPGRLDDEASRRREKERYDGQRQNDVMPGHGKSSPGRPTRDGVSTRVGLNRNRRNGSGDMLLDGAQGNPEAFSNLRTGQTFQPVQEECVPPSWPRRTEALHWA